MSDPVFQHEECDVEPVFPISDGNMLVDPTVPEPPETIPDCLNTIPTSLPPPIPAIPDIEDFCPDIEIGTATVIFENIPEPVLNLSFSESTGCAFTLNFDLRLPTAALDCPSITIDGGGSGGTVTIDENASNASLDFSITKHPTLCTFDIGFDLVLPNFCPIVTTTGSSITVNPLLSSPTLSFDVSRNSSGADCDINLDLDIQIPDFCPSISVGSATISINNAIDTPTIDFTVDKNPTSCDFVVDLTIELPDFCPTFTSGDSSIVLNEGSTSPSISITFDPGEGGEEGAYNCQFEVSASVSIPAKRVDIVEDIACSNNALVLYRKQILVLKDIRNYAPYYVPCCCNESDNPNTITTTNTIPCAPCSEIDGDLSFFIEALEGCACLQGLEGSLFQVGLSTWQNLLTVCDKQILITMTCSEDDDYVIDVQCFTGGPQSPVYQPFIQCVPDPFEVIFEMGMATFGAQGCCDGVIRVHVF